VHGVLDVFGFFQQALDGSDFVGDGGSWGADWDEAEVCFFFERAHFIVN